MSHYAKDVLSDRVLVKAAIDDTVRYAARLMQRHCCGSVAVMAGTQLCGIFTESDLATRVVAVDRDPDGTHLHDVMTRNPEIVGPTDSVSDAIRKMHDCGFQHLPVVINGEVKGMLSWRDLPMDQLGDMQPELEERRALVERLR